MTDLKSWSSPRTIEAFLLGSSTSFRQNIVLKIKQRNFTGGNCVLCHCKYSASYCKACLGRLMEMLGLWAALMPVTTLADHSCQTSPGLVEDCSE